MNIFSYMVADIAWTWTVSEIPFWGMIAIAAAVLLAVLVTVRILRSLKKKRPAPQYAAKTGAAGTEPGTESEKEEEES